jgi:hypothetical protein
MYNWRMLANAKAEALDRTGAACREEYRLGFFALGCRCSKIAW